MNTFPVLGHGEAKTAIVSIDEDFLDNHIVNKFNFIIDIADYLMHTEKLKPQCVR